MGSSHVGLGAQVLCDIIHYLCVLWYNAQPAVSRERSELSDAARAADELTPPYQISFSSRQCGPLYRTLDLDCKYSIQITHVECVLSLSALWLTDAGQIIR